MQYCEKVLVPPTFLKIFYYKNGKLVQWVIANINVDTVDKTKTANVQLSLALESRSSLFFNAASTLSAKFSCNFFK